MLYLLISSRLRLRFERYLLNRADVASVVIDGAGGQRLLEQEMKQARIKPNPILPKVAEVVVANATFERGVNTGNILHKNQPSLTQVVTNCERRPIGSNGGFGFRSQFEDYNISLMDSAILAYWACVDAKPKRQQRINY